MFNFKSAKTGAANTEAKKTSRCCKACRYYCVFIYLPVLAAVVGHILLKIANEGTDGWGGVPRSLDEETEMCPAWVQSLIRYKAHSAMYAYRQLGSTFLSGQDMAFHKSWAGDYVQGIYLAARVLIGMYSPRHSDAVKIPRTSASAPTFRVGNLIIPDRDIDDTIYWKLEWLIPRWIWNRIFPTLFNCGMGILRDFEFDDMLEDDEHNVWTNLIKPGTPKKDFYMSFYDGRYAFDGKTPLYPTGNNMNIFLKNDVWDDALEKALAFDVFGTHRVEKAEKTWGGETLPFKLALNGFSSLKTRPNFGKYGADMYFTEAGLPALIITPEGREVQRGDKDWQYWKFVWRSSLVSIVTLVDHLHMTHYRAANQMARVSRRSLPSTHPHRRLMSIFTFGTIFINNIAHHLLAAEKSPLHRATPLTDFEHISVLVPHMLKTPVEYHMPFLEPTVWEELPQMLKDAPYYADGKLLFDAIMRLSDRLYEILTPGRCGENGTIIDRDLKSYLLDFMHAEHAEEYNPVIAKNGLTCSPEMHKANAAFMWTVTGWHRHVGTVADYLVDPSLAGFSWKEGEAFTRPKQAMLMSTVAAVTGTPHPKINEDYTHLFEGIPEGEQMTKVWHEFQQELRAVEAEINKRNEKRLIKNRCALPSLVECSVAV